MLLQEKEIKAAENFKDFLEKNQHWDVNKGLEKLIKLLHELSVERLDVYNQAAKLLEGFSQATNVSKQN